MVFFGVQKLKVKRVFRKIDKYSRAAYCILRSTKTKFSGLQEFKLKADNAFQSVLSKIQNRKPSGNSDIQKLKLGLQAFLNFYHVYIFKCVTLQSMLLILMVSFYILTSVRYYVAFTHILQCLSIHVVEKGYSNTIICIYSKTCVNGPLKKTKRRS